MSGRGAKRGNIRLLKELALFHGIAELPETCDARVEAYGSDVEKVMRQWNPRRDSVAEAKQPESGEDQDWKPNADELEILFAVRAYKKRNPTVVLTIARLAIEVEREPTDGTLLRRVKNLREHGWLLSNGTGRGSSGNYLSAEAEQFLAANYP